MKVTSKYPNKIHLAPAAMQQLLTQKLPQLIVMNARLEDVKVTESEVKKILQMAMGTSLAQTDYDIIVQLSLAWKMILAETGPVNLALEQRLNTIIDLDSAAPGMFRNGTGSVMTTRGEFMPPEINEKQEAAYLNELLTSAKSTTEKALTLMYHNMCNQLFYDGNKRTALMIANKLMLDQGAGLICIPLAKFTTWMNKLTNFYFTNNMTELNNWTYQNGIITGK